MTLAVLSDVLRPLNATSSVLLNKHSLFVTLNFHLLTVLHVQLLYLLLWLLKMTVDSSLYLLIPMISSDLSS